MFLLDVFLPLPLRWLSLIVFGLGSFWIMQMFMKWYTDIDVGSILFENDESESSIQFPNLIKSLFLYTLLVLSILRVFLLFCPVILSPLLVAFGVGFALVLPINVGGLALRYKFLSLLRRISFSSWRTCNSFSEIVLADVLTSYAKVLADWDVLFWCYLLQPIYKPAASGDDDTTTLQCVPSLFSVILVCVPYLIRFRQCIGDFVITRDSKCLLNAFKYFTSFPVIYLSFLINPLDIAKSFYLLVLFLTLNFTLSTFWDVVNDWDLGYLPFQNRTKSFPFGLRPQLLFKRHVSIYYFCIVFNAAVRGIWIYKFYHIFKGNHQSVSFMDSDFGFIVMQAFEIVRRFIWLMLRIEAFTLSNQKSVLGSSQYSLKEENNT